MSYREYAVVRGDVWLHNAPNFNADSQVRVLRKGTHVHVYGQKNGMYDVGAHQYVSKKYIHIYKNAGSVPVEKSSSAHPAIPSAPQKYDWLIGAGAGFLFLIIIKDAVGKKKKKRRG